MAGAGAKVRIEGDQLIVESGGIITVKSGGTIQIEPGATLIVTPAASVEYKTGAQAIVAGVERQAGAAAKIGASAGWAVNEADNLAYLATLPAAQTAATLVVPLTRLKVGDTITGFRVVGQIASVGGAVSLDANLRSITNAASAPVDASVGSITQVAVTANTAVDSTKTGLSVAVTADMRFYVLLTATNAAATAITLLGVTLIVTEGIIGLDA